MPDEQGWEAEIRRVLAAQAGGARPMPADLAGSVLRQARRVQWRRRTAGLACVVVATLLATGGLFYGLPRPGPGVGDSLAFRDPIGDPSVDRGDPRPAVPEVGQLGFEADISALLTADVIGQAPDGGLVLAAEDGSHARLASVETVESAHRAGEGWLVTSGDEGATRLWWVVAGRPPRVVLSGMDAIVVTDSQVAWQRGSMLAAAGVSAAGELGERVSTGGPAGGGPVGFLGESVLLRRDASGGTWAWDVWDPRRGDYQPSWSERVLRVYGPLAEPDAAVGLVVPPGDQEAPCLARLRVDDGLAPEQPVCGARLPDSEAAAALSPDGRWLVAAVPAEGADGAGDPASDPATGRRLVVVDVAAVLAGDGGAVAEVPDVSAGPVVQLEWINEEQAVCVTADSVFRLWPERVASAAPEAVEEIPLGGAAPIVVVS